MQAASLCFFKCLRLLNVLQATAHLEFDDGYVGVSDKVKVKTRVHDVFGVVIGGGTETDLGDKSIEEAMYIADIWLSNKDMSKVEVRFDCEVFAKIFKYPHYSADMREFMIVSDVSVNPLHMRRNYRAPAGATQLANYMNRVHTLLDAQELLAVEGVRNQMALIGVLRTLSVKVPPSNIGIYYKIRKDRKQEQRDTDRNSIGEWLRSNFDPSFIIVFVARRYRTRMRMQYDPPLYQCDSPHLTEILTPSDL